MPPSRLEGRQTLLDDPQFITLKTACAIVGGDKPMFFATHDWGAKAGRLPAPERPSPGLSRIRRAKLIATLNGGA